MLEDTVTCDDIYLQNAAEGEEEEGEDMTRQDGVSPKKGELENCGHFSHCFDVVIDKSTLDPRGQKGSKKEYLPCSIKADHGDRERSNFSAARRFARSSPLCTARATP